MTLLTPENDTESATEIKLCAECGGRHGCNWLLMLIGEFEAEEQERGNATCNIYCASQSKPRLPRHHLIQLESDLEEGFRPNTRRN